MKPNSKLEVQAFMRQAFQNKTRIYPISTGKNWGNGSRTPWTEGCVPLDLSQLNQISDFNEELAYVTLGPGVSQLQLFEFLKQQNSQLMPNFTGSSKHASVIANALERGDGFGSYGEHANYICHLEIILPNGDLIHTGFKPQTQCAKLYRPGLGPSLDGLFFQSNLGVITEATLWLEPKPNYFHQIIFEANSRLELGAYINAASQLQLRNLTPYVAIWNREKIRSKFRNPDLECADWIGSINLFAFEPEQASSQITLAKRLFPKAQIVQADLLLEEKENLSLAYWKKPGPLPENPDPDRDLCGLLWLMCLLPYRGTDLDITLPIIESTCTQYQFEANLALVGKEPRTLKLLLALIYDREQAGLDEKAQACHDQILKKLISLGYPPYRLGLQSAWASPKNTLYEQIKNLLDPDQLLSPGHYSPLPSRLSSRSNSSL